MFYNMERDTSYNSAAFGIPKKENSSQGVPFVGYNSATGFRGDEFNRSTFQRQSGSAGISLSQGQSQSRSSTSVLSPTDGITLATFLCLKAILPYIYIRTRTYVLCS